MKWMFGAWFWFSALAFSGVILIITAEQTGIPMWIGSGMAGFGIGTLGIRAKKYGDAL